MQVLILQQTMELKEVHRLLNEMFEKELTHDRQRHIVFWYDTEKEFVEDIDSIKLDGVRIWKFSDHNLFATKYELEKKDQTSHFLLYTNMERPAPNEDWLYANYVLGEEFATDRITILMRELGIKDQHLRRVIKEYRQFFNNKTRTEAFNRFSIGSFHEELIDLTVLAVLTRSRANTIDEILKALMREQLSEHNKAWERIERFGNEEKFWALMEKYYGYVSNDRTLTSLLKFFMITYTVDQNTMEEELPLFLDKYISPRPTNVIVFMDQWMNHVEDRNTYNKLSDDIAEQLNIDRVIQNWDRASIMNMDAFRLVDEIIIHYLVDQLTNNLTHFDMYFEAVFARRRLHWYQEYKHEYEAIYYATQLLNEIERLNHFIPEQSAFDTFQTYINHYYVLDQSYRKFYVAYDQVQMHERLHELRNKIEDVYSHWYMDELALKWMGSLQREADHMWPINGIDQQKDFYQDWVKPYERNDERLFVIISDALRYEVAHELMETLNNERKASTKITAMQSGLPSSTALGMTSLLPHKTMTLEEDGRFNIDGRHPNGTVIRNEILQQNASDSMAIQFNDVMSMNREQFRETFYGKKLVYIYHNTIDARGDNVGTEPEVFQAAEEAIVQIQTLMNRLVNDLSISNVIITADHGFVYQRDPVITSQKIPQYADEALVKNRRYLLSENEVSLEGTLSYKFDFSTNKEKPLYVTIPNGVSRFAVQGAGANYVHGGAMLQEIVVPVITFKNDRSTSSRNESRKVHLKLTTPTRKITNVVTYLEFFQTERIQDKVRPRTLQAYFVNKAGEVISNKQTIIADSESAEVIQRASRERFVFKEKKYDTRETYYLLLKDVDKRKEDYYERYEFTIDI